MMTKINGKLIPRNEKNWNSNQFREIPWILHTYNSIIDYVYIKRQIQFNNLTVKTNQRPSDWSDLIKINCKLIPRNGKNWNSNQFREICWILNVYNLIVDDVYIKRQILDKLNHNSIVTILNSLMATFQ